MTGCKDLAAPRIFTGSHRSRGLGGRHSAVYDAAETGGPKIWAIIGRRGRPAAIKIGANPAEDRQGLSTDTAKGLISRLGVGVRPRIHPFPEMWTRII
jgi:hypothetical protein